MSLPEDIRQEYLKVLGIDSYFPRVILPGAPASEPCEWPPSWQALASEPPPQPAADAPAAPDTRPAANPAETTARPEMPPAANRAAAAEQVPVPEPARQAPAARPGREEIRLQLQCIRVNDSLAILNAMPHLGPQQLGGQHRSLLQNLLRAGGVVHDQMQFDDKPFRWPMVQGGHVDNSRAAAAAALSAFLQQKQADWQFSRLLVMGEFTLKQLFMPDDAAEKDPPALTGQAWQCLYARSLDECLQQPALKKDLWPVIRQCRS